MKVVGSRSGNLPFLSGDHIGQGLNSGFQAVNLAALMGYRPLILVGFDMARLPHRPAHFFGSHEGPLKDTPPNTYATFRAAFDNAAPAYRDAGVRIINASRETALTCFERATLEEALVEFHL